DHRLSDQLKGVSNCPHCGIASPLLQRVWGADKPVPRSDGEQSSIWAVFRCTTCGHLVTAKGAAGKIEANAPIVQIYPDVWEASELVPDAVRNYLSQAHRTLSAPDASVVMSASSIDAMLKDNNLSEGSLYTRIDQAVTNGILTQKMADWAHRVRLDANNPRHADASTPHMTADDAKRAFDFANALTEYLYLLPSRMPPEAQ
ncbi:MAG TPA: DUF4145 domain-containing protein, partial [Novosphingobium sp.]|nr:DUF4145 domain-containing protein [Novosphingobium sp.]